jgi:hypothetical protein
MKYNWMVALLCVWNIACWDFVEPDLAAENGAGVLQLTATLDEAGNLRANATLSPGLDPDGFRRRVTRDTVRVLAFATASDSVLRNGFHLYSLVARADTLALRDGVMVQGPAVEGVAFAPSVRWYVHRKAGPDTVRIARGSDLLLPMTRDTITPQPPASEQWLLSLTGGDRRFEISATGRPPADLHVPAEWVPAGPDSIVRVTFMSFQATQMFSADYRAFMNFTTFANWTVIVR